MGTVPSWFSLFVFVEGREREEWFLVWCLWSSSFGNEMVIVIKQDRGKMEPSIKKEVCFYCKTVKQACVFMVWVFIPVKMAW